MRLYIGLCRELNAPEGLLPSPETSEGNKRAGDPGCSSWTGAEERRPLAKEPVRKFLANKTLRRSVAKKTVAKAELRGIDVSRKKVQQWFGTDVAAAQRATDVLR